MAKWIDEIRTVPRDVSHQVEAPHQPIVLLWFLGRANEIDDRFISWQDCRKPLSKILLTAGVGQTPEFPLTVLARYGVLDYFGFDPSEVVSGSRIQKYLSKTNPAFAIPHEILRALYEHPMDFENIVDEISRDISPLSLRHSILELCGLEVPGEIEIWGEGASRIQDPEVPGDRLSDDTKIGDLYPRLIRLTHVPLSEGLSDRRSLNVLIRAGITTWGSLARLSAMDIGRLQNAGKTTVERIFEACKSKSSAVAVRADQRATVFSGFEHQYQFIPDQKELVIPLRWLGSRRNGTRLGDLVVVNPSCGLIPSDVARAIEDFLATPIEGIIGSTTDTGTSSTPEEFVELMGDRAEILIRREISLEENSTLEELGSRFHLTRERIRQVIPKLVEQAHEILKSDGFQDLRWRAFDLGGALGFAAPYSSESVQSTLEKISEGLTDSEIVRARDLIAWLAGPYRVQNGWIVRDGFSLRDAVSGSLAEFSEKMVIPLSDFKQNLQERGVMFLDNSNLLELASGWKLIDENSLIRWPKGLAEKALSVLSFESRPLLPSEINRRIGEGNANSSLQNLLSSDPRFIRVDKQNRFGLSVWGLEEYSGIAEEIRQRIERSGGRAYLSEMVEEFSTLFGVSERSVRAFAKAPAFVTEGDLVRMRRDDEFEDLLTADARAAGIFNFSKQGAVVQLLKINRDSIRGSGRGVHKALALSLGLRPGSKEVFRSAEGSVGSVTVSWPDTSMAPTIGSVKDAVEHLDLKIGDDIHIVYSLDSRECAIGRVVLGSSMGVLGIAIPEHELVHALADALSTHPARIVKELTDREDFAVLNLIPSVPEKRSLVDEVEALGDLL